MSSQPACLALPISATELGAILRARSVDATMCVEVETLCQRLRHECPETATNVESEPERRT